MSTATGKSRRISEEEDEPGTSTGTWDDFQPGAICQKAVGSGIWPPSF